MQRLDLGEEEAWEVWMFDGKEERRRMLGEKGVYVEVDDLSLARH